MLTGIYKLYWDGEPYVYVGLSQDIEARYTSHLHKLRTNSHSNKKLTDKFIEKGQLPYLEVLEECSVELLNSREIFWIDKLDSIDKGLNINNGGAVGFGPFSAYSKYSKLQILCAFRYLTNTKLTYSDIEKITKVSYSTIRSISLSNSHIWLKDEYPYHYGKLISRDIRKEYTIVSPKGTVYKTKNLKEFCTQHNLEPVNIRAVISGSRRSHKGWTALNADVSVFVNGSTQIIVTNLKKFAEENGLDPRALSKIRNGSQKKHKGWSLLRD
jgi:hypothetical protein